ncbi:MAG: NYN domain-containing protein [Bacteroidota bacterium]
MQIKSDQKLAVLIDADNIPYRHVTGMMEEITKYGIPTTKRIYGDWTQRGVSGWKSVLLEHAITPVQQYSYTKGKNSTDSAMIIDAMDILYSGKVDGFCLVSSDSDFTRLATRLRESGMYVIGIGEKKTPQPFLVACDKFIFLEILSQTEEVDPVSEPAKINQKAEKKPAAIDQLDQKTIQLIRSTINDLGDEDGWAFLGEVGSSLNKKMPQFDPRNYGFGKLTPMFKSLKQFEVDERETDNRRIKHVFIRAKKKRSSRKKA